MSSRKSKCVQDMDIIRFTDYLSLGSNVLQSNGRSNFRAAICGEQCIAKNSVHISLDTVIANANFNYGKPLG